MLERLFLRLLRLLPARYDALDLDDMRERFSRRCTDARARGRGHRLFCATREIVGLIPVILSGRRRAPRRRGGRLNAASELMHAVRRLRRAPAYAVATVLTLAVAIGVTLAALTLVHRVVLAPLPYPEADRLVSIDHDAPGVGLESIGLSLGLYWEYQTLPSVDALALYYTGLRTLSGARDAERITFLHTTTPLGRVLGITPALGRWFTDDEGRPGAPPSAFLSHRLWRERFGGASDVIGRRIVLDGVAHGIVGVGGPDLAFPDDRAAVIVALPLAPSNRRVSGFNYQGVARLTREGTVESVRREQNQVLRDLPVRFAGEPELGEGMLAEGRVTAGSESLHARTLGDAGRVVWLLWAAAIGTTVVALANVLTLALARADARMREMAVRRALGASRIGLATTLLSETVLISMAGAAGGLLIASLAVDALVGTSALPLPRLDDVRVDGMTLAAAAVVAVAAGLILGLAPLARTRRWGEHLRSGRATVGVSRVGRLTLLASQIALALTLVIAATVLARSAAALGRTHPGFAVDARLVFDISLPRATYRTRDDAARFHDRLKASLLTRAGVLSVATTSNLPLAGRGQTNPLEVFGMTDVSQLPAASARLVSPGYLETLAVPVISGRTLTEADAAAAAQTTVISESLARVYFRGTDPIDHRIRMPGQTEWLTIVGVVGDTPTDRIGERRSALVFYQAGTGLPSASYVLHGEDDPLTFVPIVRAAVTGIDPAIAVANPQRLSDLVARSGADVRFLASALVAAAAGSVILGIVGVYGSVISALVERRSELALRVALGANARQVSQAVAARTTLAVGAGLTAGLGLSLAGMRVIHQQGFELDTTQPLSYVTATLTVLAAAAAAAWWPLRRTAQIDPARVLRRG